MRSFKTKTLKESFKLTFFDLKKSKESHNSETKVKIMRKKVFLKIRIMRKKSLYSGKNVRKVRIVRLRLEL